MKALALTNLYISRAVAFFGILCAVFVFLYGFFLLEAVAHTASRAAAQRAVVALQGKVGELEGRFLSESRALTPEIAASLGFVSPEEQVRVYAQTASIVALQSVRY